MGFLGTISITWRIVAKRDVSAAADSKRLIKHSLGRGGGGRGSASGEPLSSPDGRGKNFFVVFLIFSVFLLKFS